MPSVPHQAAPSNSASLQDRHMALRLIRRPKFDIDAERRPTLGILLQLVPTFAATEQTASRFA